ncbi:MAG TPA: aminotransferase class I/II-fold pyridoxal phosphate-dependent enzyme [Coprothermobacter proteolyticus]|uniref:aminotransferase class I/II-fold pyridoxal phosphate-dependent enzyme n=1 Tax=Coprothermobacter proteolyticus TaxID=35786 RepID=UPI000D318B84|nr:aminotransferase class I/II-fold pyridoxal phosphate-dependent enzyme [Coprothermobacter proteolyticus]HOK24626.1 aminotransferase class I/II-fold pyridoxal phosphate-dependent enzyme [Coprothermobacter proteolyticus]HOL53249.1 aminotransferase class I/II-fold pyridoxal phosphate-dependent enzyme [Coprothermobacter proteolyticus]HPO83305.1 aminotransferase class I/II-fold pyridoxal phosphate-dependent enzyme [Coprothermobacter proteolyticus]HQD07694.1 aminotransferase class I/II-fold pyridox
MNDQYRTPYYSGLLAYIAKHRASFHMPGHKRGRGVHPDFKAFLGENVFLLDLTEVQGVDYLHKPTGILREAMDLLADAYGAKESFFLVNGSTVGNQAALMAVGGPGKKILIARNSHRSVVGGLILNGSIPVYLPVNVDPELGITTSVSPEVLREYLDKNDVDAVFLTNPNYYGVSGNIRELVDIVHEHGLPIVVDEAHGAHFHFHQALPLSAVDAGADLVVQSTHKTLSSMTQSSWMHMNGDLVDVELLKAALRTLQSSSPNYVLMASLDVARMQMATEGAELLSSALNVAQYLREAINEIPGLQCFGRERVGKYGIFDVDLTKITITVLGLGLTGYKVEQLLNDELGVEVELSDPNNILAFVTIGDDYDNADKLIKAMSNLSERFFGKLPPLETAAVHTFPVLPEVVLTPREAFFAEKKVVPFREAVGAISAESVVLYPPGIPVIAPGERITEESFDYVMKRKEEGAEVQGTADPELEFIQVLK